MAPILFRRTLLNCRSSGDCGSDDHNTEVVVSGAGWRSGAGQRCTTDVAEADGVKTTIPSGGISAVSGAGESMASQLLFLYRSVLLRRYYLIYSITISSCRYFIFFISYYTTEQNISLLREPSNDISFYLPPLFQHTHCLHFSYFITLRA